MDIESNSGESMKIVYLLRDSGGCGYYRLQLPMGRIKGSGVEVEEIVAGMTSNAIVQHMDADIFVIPRPMDMATIQIMETLKKAGKKVVIDYDDNMFQVSPWSIHYAEFGTEEVKINMNGEKLDLWKNGHNINTKRNKETLKLVQESVEIADLVTVTQPILAGAYLPFNSNVKCLPNCVDMQKWQRLPLKRRDDVRLYWSGGASHYQDWLLLSDVLPTIFDRYPQVNLHIMGTVFKGTIKQLDPKRVTKHEWVHTQAYPYKTAIIDADISLIPLDDNEFNKGKSNIKWIEQAALSIPSVTSALTPYVEHNNGINGVFVQNTKQDWIDGISALVEDSILRAKLGAEAFDTVERKFSIDTQYRQWIDAYQGLS